MILKTLKIVYKLLYPFDDISFYNNHIKFVQKLKTNLKYKFCFTVFQTSIVFKALHFLFFTLLH